MWQKLLTNISLFHKGCDLLFFWHSPQFYILSPRIGCFKPFSCTHTFGTLLGTYRLQFNQSNNHTHWECIQKYDLIYNRFVFSFSLSISFVFYSINATKWWQRMVTKTGVIVMSLSSPISMTGEIGSICWYSKFNSLTDSKFCGRKYGKNMKIRDRRKRESCRKRNLIEEESI